MLKRLLYVFLGLVAFIAISLATGCVNLALPLLDEDAETATVPVPPLDPDAAWTDPAYRAGLLEAFQQEVYGRWPSLEGVTVSNRKLIDGAAFGGKATIETLTLAIATREFSEPLELAVTVAVPSGTSGPVPLFLMQTFCGSHTVFARDDVPPPAGPYPGFCDGSWADPAVEYVFGQYIGRKPVEAFIDRGMALASYYPGELLPDIQEAGLDRLDGEMGTLSPRPGAIGIWAWSFSALRSYFDTDMRFDQELTVVYGHSRHGKASLLAGALDQDIDLVISHQSGRGGAALSRSPVGESVEQITDSYPHWFTPAYADAADAPEVLSVDQHHLMALIAPRPLLLGNARRDVWADPASAWRAAIAADAVYESLGSEGLVQSQMAENPSTGDVVFYLRNSRHGQTRQDFDVFLDFIERQRVQPGEPSFSAPS